MLALALILTVSTLGPLGAECGQPKITISGLGTVVGETVRFQRDSYPAVDTTIDVFRGIPFAEPPERFAKPVAKKPWSGELDATSFKSVCPQPLNFKTQTEDCLYLNIWAPSPKPQKAAVMLYIHGGGFLTGAGSDATYSGAPLVAYRDVIVVTFNYRLGVFGFLSTGDSELPGNYGMWDQLEALKWVKEHIADFGGDPNRITIFGESAGAASVSLMTLAKPSWGYYDRAIMESGTATSPWAVLDPAQARDDAFKLGRKLFCLFAFTSAKLAACLRKKSVNDIMGAMYWILAERFLKKGNIIPFVPTIDGDFLAEDPTELYRRDEFKHADVLLGTQRDEGTLIAFKAFPFKIPGPDPFLSKELFDGALSSYVYIEHDDAMLDVIRDEYVDPSDPNYFWPFTRLTSDEAFICPTDTVAKAHAKTSYTTYLYQMTHVSSFHFVPLPWDGIVPHGDDLAYVFGATFMPDLPLQIDLTEEEIDMTVDVMRYWTNFAKTGNPNLESLNDVEVTDSKTWKKFNEGTKYYKDLSPAMLDRQELRQDECHLWNEVLPGMSPSRLTSSGSGEGEATYMELTSGEKAMIIGHY